MSHERKHASSGGGLPSAADGLVFGVPIKVREPSEGHTDGSDANYFGFFDPMAVEDDL